MYEKITRITRMQPFISKLRMRIPQMKLRHKLMAVKPRFFALFSFFWAILFGVIVAAASVGPVIQQIYIASIKYNLLSSTTISAGIYSLDVHIGFFGSCIKSNNDKDWFCGKNEAYLVQDNDNYDSSSLADLSLSTLVALTAEDFRKHCLINYIWEIAIALAGILCIFIIISSPSKRPSLFNITAFLSCLGAILSLISSVDQVSSTKAASTILNIVGNNYYGIKMKKSVTTSALSWISTAFYLIAAFLVVHSAIFGQALTEIEELEEEEEEAIEEAQGGGGMRDMAEDMEEDAEDEKGSASEGED